MSQVTDADGLDETRRVLLDVVCAFAAERAAPRAHRDEAQQAFPRDLFDQLASMDLAGLPFPLEAGGSAQPYETYLMVLEELARAHVCLALGLSVHTLATWAVVEHASAEVRAELAHRMTAGEWLGAYSLSEPGAGSDAAALSCRAERHGDDYLLSGTKAWVTHVGIADFYTVFARTRPPEAGEPRSAGVTALLVPAGTEGVTFAAAEDKMGLRASPTGQVFFDEARVPARYRLGAEGEGFAVALGALDGGRLGIAACAVGLAQAALDCAADHAREREQFGRPIAEFQGVGFLLADAATGIGASRALYRSAAARRDRGEPYTQEASMAKLLATDTAMQVTTDAVQVLGGYGYTTDYPAERLLRAAKATQIFEGSNQIQRMLIARHLLGERAASR